MNRFTSQKSLQRLGLLTMASIAQNSTSQNIVTCSITVRGGRFATGQDRKDTNAEAVASPGHMTCESPYLAYFKPSALTDSLIFVELSHSERHLDKHCPDRSGSIAEMPGRVWDETSFSYDYNGHEASLPHLVSQGFSSDSR